MYKNVLNQNQGVDLNLLAKVNMVLIMPKKENRLIQARALTQHMTHKLNTSFFAPFLDKDTQFTMICDQV